MMSEYKLELKQIVSYPRCRIYRQFIRSLMEDKNIRANGCSYLFYYIVLCSFSNYQTSYRSFDGIRYIIFPGEWICRLSELPSWFRLHTKRKALLVMDQLQQLKMIEYNLLGRNQLVKFKILNWNKSNKYIDEHAPCQKDMGFFFFPISKVHELVSVGRCSELDIILDLWIHAIYNDPQVQGSEVGPVVYFRNNTGNPLTAYANLADRWGLSKTTVSRILKKMEGLGHLRLISFSGRHGTAIYLNNYLSTMFGISDVMVHKEEVSFALNMKVVVPQTGEDETNPVGDSHQICVSNDISCVPKPHLLFILRKVAEVLMAQGFSCPECRHSTYRLSSLSPGCREGSLRLEICCNTFEPEYFALRIIEMKPNLKETIQSE